MGINPLLLNKLLPPVLGVLTTGYCFGVCLEMLPLPGAGFTATLLLNQIIWMKDDLVSATPRAFAYPLFLAFLYYLLRRSLLGSAVLRTILSHYVSAGLDPTVISLREWTTSSVPEPKRLSAVCDWTSCSAGTVALCLEIL